MEKEFQQLIDIEKIQEEQEPNDDEQDEFQQSMDIDMFEQKLKIQKRPQSTTISQQKQSQFNTNNNQIDLQIKDIPKNDSKKQEKSRIAEIQKEIVKQKPKKVANEINQVDQEEVEEILNQDNDSLKDKKIKELVKKNKNLFVQLEKERVQRSKIENQVKDMMKQTGDTLTKMEMKETNLLGKKVTVPIITQYSNLNETGISKLSKQSSINKLNEEELRIKYKEADKKLQEFRFSNQQLKNELNKSLRVIQKEIGENFNIDEVLMEENSWRGRAQQIEILKAKLRDLQQKQNQSSILTKSDQISEISTFHNQQARDTTGLTGKAKERREEIENLKQLSENQKSEIEILQGKIKAINSRKSILEAQNKSLIQDYEKNKKILLEKSENDNRYINALKQEIEKIKNSQPQPQTKIIYKQNDNQMNQLNNDDKNLKKLKQDLKYLQNEIQKKDQIINDLISQKNQSQKENLVNITNEYQIQENEKLKNSIKSLEDKLKAMHQENHDLTQKLFGIKNPEEVKTLKDLTQQNAQLRRKIDDLLQKQDRYENNSRIQKN